MESCLPEHRCCKYISKVLFMNCNLMLMRHLQTRAGPVLIAVNPFKKVPIYGESNVRAYQNRTAESSQPHVYMSADSAFGAMMKGGYLHVVGMKSMVWVMKDSSSFRVPCQRLCSDVHTNMTHLIVEVYVAHQFLLNFLCRGNQSIHNY